MKVGSAIELSSQALTSASDEHLRARDELEKSYNSIVHIGNSIKPILAAQVDSVRQLRFTVEREAKLIFNAISDTKNMVLTKDYERTMERVNEYICACEKIKKLKDDGIFDAVAEFAIKLHSKGDK